MIKEALDQAIVPLALKQFRTIPQNTLKANLNERERCVVMLVGYGALHLSEDVVRCIGAVDRYVYRRNPG